MNSAPLKIDLLIQGGSYIGLSLAIAVKQACPFLKIFLIDSRNLQSWEHDSRSFAIAAAAVRMLKQMGIWEKIKDETQPIHEIIITDSRTNDPIRPTFLTFSGELQEGEAFAHMVETKILITTLYRKAQDLGIQCLNQHSIIDFNIQSHSVIAKIMDLTKNNSFEIITKLLVAADGVNSKLREKAQIKTVHWPYKQMGIICTIKHEREHFGRAEEHFLPAGPFATLPLKGNRSSLVWNEEPNLAQKLVEGDLSFFNLMLKQRFGHHLGQLQLLGKRQAFPFGLTLVRDFIKPRFALAGDSAHGIHPISGQGLNLGFRDVALLAEIIVHQARLGLDIGDFYALEKYQRGRRFETVRMGITTDVLNRLFSNDSDFLRFIRDLGLGLVDRSSFLKNYFIKEASGITENTPKLLLGHPL